MAEDKKTQSVGELYTTDFYKADAQLNQAVFRVAEATFRGAVLGAAVSLLFKNKRNVIWTCAGLGAGFAYQKEHLHFKKFKLHPN
mmetsp:Transcript_42006/g.48723  ORF Transcript_42006/g.48723 Transcript_42006/m.48723 type:complete len:85 (-) Transcript_42006:133-387(-)